MAIDGLNFLQATSPHYIKQSNASYSGIEPYHQAYIGKNSQSQINPAAYTPTVEDLELANAIAEGNYNVNSTNIFAPRQVSTPKNVKGAQYDGFNVPENNGTGELIPNVSDRVDSIENCPWEAYMA